MAVRTVHATIECLYAIKLDDDGARIDESVKDRLNREMRAGMHYNPSLDIKKCRVVDAEVVEVDHSMTLV